MSSQKATVLLEHHLKELKLSTILREYAPVAATCTAERADYATYLLRLTERELLDRERLAAERRLKMTKFSVTKTMGAAVSLLRLAKIYGPEVLDLKIADFLKVSADHDGWDDVTFAHALNMAVGVGEKSAERDPPKILAGEDSERFFEWINAPSREEKLRLAFAFPDYPWGPGEVARYDTTHTFVLAAAMAIARRLRRGQSPDDILEELTPDEIENAAHVAERQKRWRRFLWRLRLRRQRQQSGGAP